jgi:hypothetical protein
MKNKYERIEFVRELGLNTEENILVRPNDNFYLNSKQFGAFFKGLNQVSIRTFYDNSKLNTIHYPIIGIGEVENIVKTLQKNNLNAIIATPIDPKDCEFAGTCLKDGHTLVFELADGPGTVRRVTRQSVLDRRYYLPGLLDNTIDYRVNYAINEFRKVEIDDCVFEFSWYSKHVGWKSDNFIVWEVTDSGFGKSGL